MQVARGNAAGLRTFMGCGTAPVAPATLQDGAHSRLTKLS